MATNKIETEKEPQRISRLSWRTPKLLDLTMLSTAGGKDQQSPNEWNGPGDTKSVAAPS